MLNNSKIEKRFGLRFNFKGGGGGLTGATTNSETANEQEVTSTGSGSSLHTGNIAGGVSITSSDPEVAEYAINANTYLAGQTTTEIADLADTFGEGQIQENLAATNLVDNISGELGQITANAAPQTPAAESEILSGTSPTTPAGNGAVVTSGLANTNNIIWIGVGALALIWYANRK